MRLRVFETNHTATLTCSPHDYSDAVPPKQYQRSLDINHVQTLVDGAQGLAKRPHNVTLVCFHDSFTEAFINNLPRDREKRIITKEYLNSLKPKVSVWPIGGQHSMKCNSILARLDPPYIPFTKDITYDIILCQETPEATGHLQKLALAFNYEDTLHKETPHHDQLLSMRSQLEHACRMEDVIFDKKLFPQARVDIIKENFAMVLGKLKMQSSYAVCCLPPAVWVWVEMLCKGQGVPVAPGASTNLKSGQHGKGKSKPKSQVPTSNAPFVKLGGLPDDTKIQLLKEVVEGRMSLGNLQNACLQASRGMRAKSAVAQILAQASMFDKQRKAKIDREAPIVADKFSWEDVVKEFPCFAKAGWVQSNIGQSEFVTEKEQPSQFFSDLVIKAAEASLKARLGGEVLFSTSFNFHQFIFLPC